MSILLEALKKAALEKQRRDLGNESVGRVNDEHLDSVPANSDFSQDNKSESELEKLAVESEDNPTDFSLDVDFDELALETDKLGNVDEPTSALDDPHIEDKAPDDLVKQFIRDQDESLRDEASEHESRTHESRTQEYAENESLLEEPLGISDVNNEDHTQEGLESVNLLKNKEADSQDIKVEANQADTSNAANSDSSPASNHNSLDPASQGSNSENSVLEKSNSSKLDSKDASEESPGSIALDDSDSSTASDKYISSKLKQQESFALLLEKNRNLQKSKKRKFIILYILLAILFSLAIGIYFLSVHYSSKNALFQNNPSVQPYLGVEYPVIDKLSDADMEEAIGGESYGVVEGVVDSAIHTSADRTIDDKTIDGISHKQAETQPTNSKSTGSVSNGIKNTSKSANAGVNKVEAEKKLVKKITERFASSETASRGESQNAVKSSRSSGSIVTKVTSSSSPIDTLIFEAYHAFNQAEYTKARSLYAQALEIDPDQKDALLGSAAIAVAQGRIDEALNFYQLRLNRSPNDSYAHSGLLSIATNRKASPELLSSVNNLLKDYSGAAHLHFLKGVIHSQESQWGAAQSAFFNAWSRDELRRDYAYNLAIALDHLKQHNEALRFYRMALSPQGILPVAIDTVAVRTRIRALESAQ